MGEALVGRGPLGPGEEEAGLSLRGSSPAEPRLRQAPAAGTAGASGWEPGVLAQPRAPVSGSLCSAAAPELPHGRSCLARYTWGGAEEPPACIPSPRGSWLLRPTALAGKAGCSSAPLHHPPPPPASRGQAGPPAEAPCSLMLHARPPRQETWAARGVLLACTHAKRLAANQTHTETKKQRESRFRQGFPLMSQGQAWPRLWPGRRPGFPRKGDLCGESKTWDSRRRGPRHSSKGFTPSHSPA